MDLPSIKQEPSETDGTPNFHDDAGSDLVSVIKCEDYQLMEAATDDNPVSIKEDPCSFSDVKESPQDVPSPETLHCPDCNKPCPSANALRLHRRRLHKPAEPVVRPQYRCTECDRTFQFQRKLKHHQETHNQVPCPVCDKIVVQRSLKEHLAAHEGAIRCAVCSKTLSSYRALNLHRKLLHASSSDHTRVAAEKTRCGECDRVFSNAAQLNSHMRSHQQQECPVCKSMRSKSSIKEHIASHGGAFRCAVCDGTFCSKRRLKYHMASKHAADGGAMATENEAKEEGKHRCLQCKRVFDSEKQLLEHGSVHQRKQCPICRKNVRQRNYPAHMAVHAYRS
ncbi:zinc finger protein 425-like isoform X1 [Anopheles arabiensis]|uniref:C2H2-type domain-containing protein n=1 Tax=Anopheles arabiensis TaxID=7173 RepID=A0A182I7H9_ANOAR|nr:zinc finger protein 425-like isoform X1 [Anopheles arabiensis]